VKWSSNKDDITFISIRQTFSLATSQPIREEGAKATVTHISENPSLCSLNLKAFVNHFTVCAFLRSYWAVGAYDTLTARHRLATRRRRQKEHLDSRLQLPYLNTNRKKKINSLFSVPHICSTRDYCKRGEVKKKKKKELHMLTDLHVFSTPEYKKSDFFKAACLSLCLHVRFASSWTVRRILFIFSLSNVSRGLVNTNILGQKDGLFIRALKHKISVFSKMDFGQISVMCGDHLTKYTCMGGIFKKITVRPLVTLRHTWQHFFSAFAPILSRYNGVEETQNFPGTHGLQKADALWFRPHPCFKTAWLYHHLSTRTKPFSIPRTSLERFSITLTKW
jgi:hypothetical protein